MRNPDVDCGAQSVVCTLFSSYSNIPSCEVIECVQPTVNNGVSKCTAFEGFGLYQYKTRCTFTCNDGYVLSSDLPLNCGINGAGWDRDIPTCDLFNACIESPETYQCGGNATCVPEGFEATCVCNEVRTNFPVYLRA